MVIVDWPVFRLHRVETKGLPPSPQSSSPSCLSLIPPHPPIEYWLSLHVPDCRHRRTSHNISSCTPTRCTSTRRSCRRPTSTATTSHSTTRGKSLAAEMCSYMRPGGRGDDSGRGGRGGCGNPEDNSANSLVCISCPVIKLNSCVFCVAPACVEVEINIPLADGVGNKRRRHIGSNGRHPPFLRQLL